MNTQPVDRHFRKDERLCGEIRTEKLFSAGKGFIVYPLRVVYRIPEPDEVVPVRILLSVPKKKIRLAVNRNRIKRLLRETYRNQKHFFVAEMEKKGIRLHVGFVYLSNEMPSFHELEEKMAAALRRIHSGIIKKGDETARNNPS